MAYSRILEEDLKKIANSCLPFEKYRGCTFLVTGATGLIGSLIIKNLLYINHVYNLDIKIKAMIRNYDKAKKIYLDYINFKELTFIVQDMNVPFWQIEGVVDFIIHTAAVTNSSYMINFPVETIKTAVIGTNSILEMAREKEIRGMVYVSSMEVYGNIGSIEHAVTEKELGYIDISSVRSGYPEGKRLCECLCNAYAKQYNMHIVNARLAQTFGAGILPGENRVFAQFAKSAIEGTDIILHTKGLSEGNYIYTADAVKAIFLLLTEGASGESYNISNEKSHTTIADMAKLVSEKIANNNIKLIYDIPENLESMGYAPDVKLYLSSGKLQKLGWKATVGLQESYERMIEYIKEVNNGSYLV